MVSWCLLSPSMAVPPFTSAIEGAKKFDALNNLCRQTRQVKIVLNALKFEIKRLFHVKLETISA